MSKKNAYDSTGFTNALTTEFGAEDDLEIVPDNTQIEVPAPEEAAPSVVPETETDPTEAAPAAEPAATTPSWSDDYSQIKAELDFLKGTIQKGFPVQTQNQTTPPAPKPLRDITDESEYAQRMEQLERVAHNSHKAIQSLELQNAQRALAELKQQYPDIDQYIPMEQVQRGVALRIDQGAIGQDWKEPLLKVYDVTSGGARYNNQSSKIAQLEAELQKAKDELAAKRADREAKVRDLQSAGMVPAGGSVYQETAQAAVPFVNGQQRGKKAYDAAGRAMTAALSKH